MLDWAQWPGSTVASQDMRAVLQAGIDPLRVEWKTAAKTTAPCESPVARTACLVLASPSGWTLQRLWRPTSRRFSSTPVRCALRMRPSREDRGARWGARPVAPSALSTSQNGGRGP